MKFSCPHCDQHIEADDSYAGQTIECPHCGDEMTVSAPTAPEFGVCPACGQGLKTPDPVICINCGHRFRKLPIQEADNNGNDEYTQAERKKFIFWSILGVVALPVAAVVNIAAFLIFGIWGSSILVAVLGIILAKVLKYSKIQTVKTQFLTASACTAGAVAVMLIPHFIYSFQGIFNIHFMWIAGYFFFGVTGFCFGIFESNLRRYSMILFIAFGVICFYTEPEYWGTVKSDRDWSTPVCLTETGPMLPAGDWSHPQIYSDGKRIILRNRRDSMFFQPENNRCLPVAADTSGNPATARPSTDTMFIHEYIPPVNQEPQPELSIFYYDDRNPEKPQSKLLRNFLLDVKKLIPDWDSLTARLNIITFFPSQYLPDGKLEVIYQAKFTVMERRGRQLRILANCSRISSGKLSLDLLSGRWQVTATLPPLPVDHNQYGVWKGIPWIFYIPSVKQRETLFVVGDFNTGKWNEPEKTFDWLPGNGISESSIIAQKNDLQVCYADIKETRLRVPILIFGTTGYYNPAEVCFRSRDMVSGAWGAMRILSPGFKFAKHPVVAAKDDNIVVVWHGKKRGESMFAADASNLYYVFSSNCGKTWTAPALITSVENLSLWNLRPVINKNSIHLFFTGKTPGEDMNARRLYHITRKLPGGQP